MMVLARTVLLRRMGPLGVALTSCDLPARLPKRARQRLVVHGQRQGLRIARLAQALMAQSGTR